MKYYKSGRRKLTLEDGDRAITSSDWITLKNRFAIATLVRSFVNQISELNLPVRDVVEIPNVLAEAIDLYYCEMVFQADTSGEGARMIMERI